MLNISGQLASECSIHHEEPFKFELTFPINNTTSSGNYNRLNFRPTTSTQMQFIAAQTKLYKI